MGKVMDYFSVYQRYNTYGHPKSRMLCPIRYDDGMNFLLANRDWQHGKKNTVFPDVHAGWCKDHAKLPISPITFGFLAMQIFMRREPANILMGGTGEENIVLVPTYIQDESGIDASFVSVVVPMVDFNVGVNRGYTTFIARDRDVLALIIDEDLKTKLSEYIDPRYFGVVRST